MIMSKIGVSKNFYGKTNPMIIVDDSNHNFPDVEIAICRSSPFSATPTFWRPIFIGRPMRQRVAMEATGAPVHEGPTKCSWAMVVMVLGGPSHRVVPQFGIAKLVRLFISPTSRLG